MTKKPQQHIKILKKEASLDIKKIKKRKLMCAIHNLKEIGKYG